MIRVKTLIVFSILATSQLVWVASAEAGPLLDWLLHRNRCCNNRVFRPAAPAPNCGTCTTTCQQTCQRVVVNYVPYTAYRSSWERVPVTTYRQTSSTDPCTGCTVTCNRPCTSYSWRMKQEPFTTYRPVYRTETYQTPVTYSTPAPACNTCAMPAVQSPTCNTCAMPPAYQTAPAGTINPGTTYSPYYPSAPTAGAATYEPTPATGRSAAETQPTLDPQLQQKPVIIEGESRTYWPTQINSQPTGTNTSTNYSPVRDPNPSARWNNNNAPQLLNPFNHSASAPSVERWNYSPVKLASYQAPLKTPAALQTNEPAEYVGSFATPERQQSNWQQSPTAQPKPAGQRLNEGWRQD